jgi:hypothetical protein
MKKITVYSCLTILLCCMITACQKMDSTYKEFIVPGGITYTGKITSPIVYTGRGRVKIAWLRGADPTVVKTRIYWNSQQDSMEVAIPATGDTISAVVSGLQEKQYNFIVKTFDAQGNNSVPVELLGESFGTRYESLLLARPINASEIDGTGVLTIQWGNANLSGGAYATEVKYTDVNNVVQVKRFLVAESISTIIDYKMGTVYQYRTVYIPGVRGIDSFFTPYINQYVSAKLNKSTWLATADSFAASSQLPNGPAIKAIDDDIKTFWHTETTSSRVYPHWLAVDMKKTINVSRVELTCRQDNFTTFTAFSIQGSIDGLNWTDYGGYTFVMKNVTQSFAVANSPQMKYIRIYAATGPNYYANLAEITVFGYE